MSASPSLRAIFRTMAREGGLTVVTHAPAAPDRPAGEPPEIAARTLIQPDGDLLVFLWRPTAANRDRWIEPLRQHVLDVRAQFGALYRLRDWVNRVIYGASVALTAGGLVQMLLDLRDGGFAPKDVRGILLVVLGPVLGGFRDRIMRGVIKMLLARVRKRLVAELGEAEAAPPPG